MNGPIAQIVALTCYGNAVLSGHKAPPFFPANSTCQFCERVAFVTLDKTFFGKVKEEEVAKSPDDWFSLLKSQRALGIRLVRAPQDNPGISDRMSAGFVGGGGTWTMEVLLPKQKSNFWSARWEVWNQKAPDRRIWRVAYGRVSEATARGAATADLIGASRELRQSLQEIREFSAKHGLDGFTKCFDDALDTLASEGKNLHGYHQDLAPRGILSEEAAMILDASQPSWVFGGMGSWNDMGFDGEEQQRYDRISERLFQAVNSAIETAATTSFKEGRTSKSRVQ